jgi:hypothetical protein
MISTKNFLEITNDFCDLEMINDFYAEITNDFYNLEMINDFYSSN